MLSLLEEALARKVFLALGRVIQLMVGKQLLNVGREDPIQNFEIGDILCEAEMICFGAKYIARCLLSSETDNFP